jgi:hypothetical protein
MAVAAVAFNGTRLNDSDANTGWGNFVAGGGAPASEFPLAYQVTSGTTTGAVNKKITSSTARQGVDYNGSSVDFTNSANRLLFVKVLVADSFDLNTTWGVEIGIGSADTSNSHRYNIAGSGANLPVYSQYPAQGGYLITAIDPTIDAWAETVDQGGAFDQTAVIWYALGAQFVNGTAKAENVAFDAIDYGTGLTITAGDGASTEGNFTDFVAADQDTKANRWGVVTGSGDNVTAHGVLTVGTSAVTEFLDLTSVVVFPDGYHSAGLVGVAVGMSNASSIINIGALLIGEGSAQTPASNDTRPDFVVTGTSGTFDFSGTMRNFRNVTFTSICDVANANIECELLTQASCNINDTTITTRSAASTATLQDPTFGTTTDLHDCTFIQGGAGHAIEIDTAGTYTLTNINFSGYSASADNAASTIWVSAATGDSTINIIGGTEPSIRNTGAGTVTVVLNPVTLKVIVRDLSTGSLITSQDVNVLVEADTGGPLSVGTDIIKGFTDINGEIEDTRTYASNQPITGWARKSSGSPYYVQAAISATIDKDNGLILTLLMARDD